MFDRSRLGVVSNCWQQQLAEGQPLEALIERAVTDCGFRQIELRQGALGRLEDGNRLPDTAALTRLAAAFPQVGFDLAVELPVFSESVTRDHPHRQRYLDAAAALSGHLRIVDLTPCSLTEATDDWLSLVTENLLALTDDLPQGLVSVEHSVQPWSVFWPAFERARADHKSTLKLCFDPTNLWLTGDGVRAADITRHVPVDSLSMVHLKQRRGSAVLPSFGPGDVAWRELLPLFQTHSYSGPYLFEIAPGASVWEELEAGVRFLDDLLATQ